MQTFITLQCLRFFAHHGAGEQERLIGNEYTVGVRLAVDFRRAMQTDEVADTVDYAQVYQSIKAEMAVPSRLLEHVGGRIANRIFRDFPRVIAIDLTLSKRNPPMGADIEEATIEIHLSRGDF